MAIKNEIIDELLKGQDPKLVFSSAGLLGELKKALAERILNTEMDLHLSESNVEASGEGAEAGNHRNGYSKKTVLTESEAVDLSIPRDRRGSFEPQLIAKYQRRFPGFDDKIISMYGRGMSVREIQGHLHELYGMEVSPQLISTVTDAVLEEVGRWQSRPLDALYAIVFFDALRVKMRDEGTVRNKAVYLAIGVTPDGRKDVLGIWIEQTEGAKFWLRVMTELKNRGVNDILIAVVDGLKGFPEAINAVFPETQIQTCIVHVLRHSLDYASWKERKPIATALKNVYRATDVEAASAALSEFEDGPWGQKYSAIGASWRRNWQQVIPFLAYPQEVRKMIYTTNAIESLNSKLRRSVRARGHFPNDEAAMKLIWLQLREVTKEWTMAPKEWHAARAQFALIFGDRFEAHFPGRADRFAQEVSVFGDFRNRPQIVECCTSRPRSARIRPARGGCALSAEIYQRTASKMTIPNFVAATDPWYSSWLLDLAKGYDVAGVIDVAEH